MSTVCPKLSKKPKRQVRSMGYLDGYRVSRALFRDTECLKVLSLSDTRIDNDTPENIDNEVGFKYFRSTKVDCVRRYITTIEFDISRYGEFRHQINFPYSVTEEEALAKVEEFLSEAVTERYYNVVASDLFCPMPLLGTRGNLLSDCTFLEGFKTIKGVTYICCGS